MGDMMFRRAVLAAAAVRPRSASAQPHGQAPGGSRHNRRPYLPGPSLSVMNTSLHRSRRSLGDLSSLRGPRLRQGHGRWSRERPPGRSMVWCELA